MRELQGIDAVWAESWDELASNRNGCPQGTLSYTDSSGILLRLHDSVWSTEIPKDIRSGATTGKRLYGLSCDDRHFVLDEAMADDILVVSEDDGMAHGMAARAKRLLVSSRPFNPDADVKSAILHIVGLREWLGDTDDLPIVLFEDDEMTIRAQESDASEDEFVIDVRPKASMSLARLDDVVSTLAAATTFCCCFYTDVTELDVTFGGFAEPVTCVMAFVKGPGPDGRNPKRAPLTRDVLPGTQNFLREWLYPSHDVALLRERLLSLMFRGWRLPPDVKFLAAAQVLEALTKTGRDNYVLPQDKFKAQVKAVLAAIDDAQLRDWAEVALKGNYKSAPELLEEFMSECPDTVRWIGIGDSELFQKRHKHTRNQLTHLRGKPPKDILTGGELRWHTNAVLLLSYCAIADFCGIPEGDVLAALDDSGFMRRERLQVARLYPVNAADQYTTK